MYYLTITARRKDAKRHVVTKSQSVDYLRAYGSHLKDSYKREIYDGRWALVETIGEEGDICTSSKG